MIMFFIWMIVTGLFGEISSMFTSGDGRTSVPAIFVVCAYGVMLLRGVGELREASTARRDADWLRERLASERRAAD